MSTVRFRKTSRVENGVEIPGGWLYAFIHNGDYFLTEIKIFKDGRIHCWELMDLEGFKNKIRNGWVVTSLPEGAQVSVSSLAYFKATNVTTFIKEEEFVKEVIDVIAELNGEPTTWGICIQAFQEFQKTKSDEARLKLKTAYEAVPEHNRKYLSAGRIFGTLQ